jgi:hypothetical protein
MISIMREAAGDSSADAPSGTMTITSYGNVCSDHGNSDPDYKAESPMTEW